MLKTLTSTRGGAAIDRINIKVMENQDYGDVQRFNQILIRDIRNGKIIIF